MQLKSTRHAGYLCNYHFVFIPKYRRLVLEKYRDDLEEIFYQIAKKWNFEILALEITPDYVHLFISAPPKYAPAQIIKYSREHHRGSWERSIQNRKWIQASGRGATL